jgi:hypothetical protein
MIGPKHAPAGNGGVWKWTTAEARRTLRYVSSSIHQTKRSAELSQGFSTVAYPPSAARSTDVPTQRVESLHGS